ncbi:hypothetical protein AB4Z25_10765 [Rhizobium sp. RAF36]|uniref:GCG_CRPN prefix-to-repeats domain-containing protein n=1 Tax=Rhizobium sp. RAF36 TaxID=3233055 RepID=UPI000DD5CC1E
MKIITLAAALVIGGLSALSAEAMPVAPLAVDNAAASDVTKVDYACGRGWHMTRWGECRRNDYRRHAPPVRYWHRPPPPRWGWGGGWERPRPYYRDRDRGWDGGGRYDRY